MNSSIMKKQHCWILLLGFFILIISMGIIYIPIVSAHNNVVTMGRATVRILETNEDEGPYSRLRALEIQQQKKQQHNNKQLQQQNHRRNLAEARHDGQCHTDLLKSSPDENISNLTTMSLGLFFSLENTNPSSNVDISSFSVYFDETRTSPFNFTIYTMDGYYLQRDVTTGNITSIGNWNVLASGTDVTLNDFSLDENGASLIPFASFGYNSGGEGNEEDGSSSSSIVLGPNSVKSFYMGFTDTVMAVDDAETYNGAETEDESVTLSSEGSGLKMYVGRKNILPNFMPNEYEMPIPDYELELFFSASRFVGRIWSKLDTCSPSLSPTPAPSSFPSVSPSAMPSESPTPAPSRSPTPAPTKLETLIVFNNTFVMNFAAPSSRRRRELMVIEEESVSTRTNNKNALRKLQGGTTCPPRDPACLTQDQLNSVQSMFQTHIDNMYTEQLQSVTFSRKLVQNMRYTDTSAGCDCSRIEFMYDLEIALSTVAGDETTIDEIVRLPLDSDENKETFVNLVSSSDSSLPVSSVEGIIVPPQPVALSTRTPTSTPSISLSPTAYPSASPSESPTGRPSISSKPTVSSAPSSSPSAVPSISSRPTVSARPTSQPSGSPTISTAPTNVPSNVPSMQPTISQAPTASPSDVPSLSPTASPSDVPSQSPTTTFNYMTVEYSFDISYPPGDGSTEQIEQYITGNITSSLERILSDPNDLLYNLAVNYDLGFSQAAEAGYTWVFEDEDPADIDCKYDPANSDNICKRFVIRVYFQHKRTISANLVRGWLLEVSDRILGTLQASYTGDEAVRSVQVMVLPDVEEYPEDVAAVCEIVQEILANSTIIQNSNYTILEVECLGFEIVYNVPADGRGIFKTRLNRGLRRVQEVLGDAKVEFRVTGEYTQANRVDEEEKDMEFDTLLEDSINKDVGKDISSTLKERNVVAMKGTGQIITQAKITETPTQSPIERPVIDFSQVVTETSSSFASGGTGVAVIITCSLVLVLVGGFLFYKGMQRSKEDEESFFWEDDDFSSVDSDSYMPDDKQKMYAAGVHVQGDDFTPPRSDERSDETPEMLPEHYSGAETNIFGTVVGSSRDLLNNNQDILDEKLQIHQDITVQRNESRRKLDAFDERLQQKLNPRDGNEVSAQDTLENFDQRMQRKLDGGGRGRSPAPSQTFEQKLQKKLSNSNNDNKRPSREGSESSFEQRLMRKMSEGSLSRSPSPSQRGLASSSSSRQLDSFEARIAEKARQGEKSSGRSSRDSSPGSGAVTYDERIKKKLSRDREDSGGSQSSFEDRLRAKLNEGSNKSRSRGRSPGMMIHIASSTESSRRLDDLEKRIAAKSKEEDNSRERPRVEASSSSRELDDFESRIRAKSTEGSRKPNQLSSSMRSLDSYEERIRAKSKEGQRSGSRDQLSSSMTSIDSFEERIRAKSMEGDSNKGRPRVEASSSSRGLDDFESRIRAKSKEGQRSGSRDKLSSSMTSIDSFEQRIAAKSNGNASKSRADTYESRLNKKLSEGNLSRSRSVSPGALTSSASTSSRKLDSFEARIAAKTKEGQQQSQSSSSRLTRGQMSSSMTSIDSFEARIAAKSMEGNASKSRADTYESRLNKKLSEGNLSRSRSASPGALTSSSSTSSRKLDSFEARIAAKTKDGQHLSSSRQPRGQMSSSMTSIDSFEARIAAKSMEGGRKQTRSPSPGVSQSFSSPSDASSSRFDAAFAKARARNTIKDLSHSEERAKARLEHNEKLNVARSRGTSPIVSTESSRKLDSFEARIAEKSKQGNTSKYRENSPTTSATSYEERLKKMMSEGQRHISSRSIPTDGSKKNDSFESKLQAKLAKSNN